jgi:hypothetical protein
MSILILPRRFREQKEPFPLHCPTAILEAKYKVQICRNHEYVISEPLGPGFHDNLITNFGLDATMTGTSLAQLVSTAAKVGSGTNAPAVTDTNLQTPLKGSNTYFTGGGIQAVNDTVNGACAFTNVFEFAAEVGSVTYNEVGLSANPTPATANCFTRALFGSPVSLTNGQNLRLTYTLNISQPATVTPITVSLAAVNGFNISGQLKAVGTFANLFGSATSSSISWANDPYWRCSASSSAACQLCSAPTTFPTVNTNLGPTFITNAQVSSPSLSTYTNGSFTRSATYVWNPSTPPTTVSNVNGLLWSQSGFQSGVYLILTSAQTKANTNTLTVTLTSSVARA